MFALVLAMVTLTNAAPDAVATPSSAIANRLPGSASATGLAPLDTTSPLGSITVTTGCSYGSQRLGQAYPTDFADLTRTPSAPACDDQTSSGFGTGLPLSAGYVPLYGFVRPTFDNARDGSTASTVSTFTLPARMSFRPFPHVAQPTDFRASAGPATAARGATVRSVSAGTEKIRH
jgi:hypothetical protein